jgi:hypothetical protein
MEFTGEATMGSVTCGGCGKQVYDKLTKCPYCHAGMSQAASLSNAAQSAVDRINSLDLSSKWKQRFILIAKAGGPEVPQLRQLAPKERRAIGFNIFAFLFGPFYYLLKGLWRQASVYFGLTVLCIFAMDAAGLEQIDRMAGGAASVIYGWRANISYYRRAVLGETFWL